MKKSKIPFIVATLCTSLLVHAQDVPEPEIFNPEDSNVAAPEDMGDADPLDGLDKSQPSSAPAASPSLPEYRDVTQPELPAPPAAPMPVAEKPKKKSKARKEYAANTTGDEVDYTREARYHEIYKKFNSEPTSVENWEKAVGDRKSEVYRVQKGDTLWDVSNTFFADPQFWPKIWALNKQGIMNPHQIVPDMNIKFFPGNVNDVPTIGLAANDAGDDEGTPETGGEQIVDADTVASVAGAGGVIPPARARIPVLKKLPKSLPQYRNEIVDNQPAQFQIELPHNRFPRPTEYLTYFIADEPVKGVGKVSETESVLRTSSEGQYIYVHLNDSNQKHYMVQKNEDVVLDPLQKGRKGNLVEVQGEIEVLEAVNPAKNIYRAKVVKSLQLIEVGAVLVPGQLPVIKPTPSPVVSGVAARIMGGQFWGNRKLFGADGIVFLDSGSSRGMQEGQTLNIYADQSLRNQKTEAMANDRVIGTVKILRTTPNFSTAYVLSSTMDIVTGDSVGQPRSTANASAVQKTSMPTASESDFDLDLDDSNSPASPPMDGTDSGASDEDFEL